jgi:hypothetical protein
MAALRGDISFRYLKQFFLVYYCITQKIINCSARPSWSLSIYPCLSPLKLLVLFSHTTEHYCEKLLGIKIDTYQISFTYLERQKCYGPDKKILFKKQLFDLEVKGRGPTKVITVCDTPPYGHAPTYQT